MSLFFNKIDITILEKYFLFPFEGNFYFLIDPLSIVRNSDINTRFIHFSAMLSPTGKAVQRENAYIREK